MKTEIERLQRLAKLEAQKREDNRQRFGSQGAASAGRRVAVCSTCGKSRDRLEGDPPTFVCEACQNVRGMDERFPLLGRRLNESRRNSSRPARSRAARLSTTARN